jgi:hypothetical protein
MLEIKAPTRRPGATPTMDTRAIQRALNKAVAAGLTVDGVLGPLTRNAIRTFQRTRGLTADGVVGAATVRALAPFATAAASMPMAKAVPKAKPSSGGATGKAPAAVPALGSVETRFMVLDDFVFNDPAAPSAHDKHILRIAHLVVASWTSPDPIRRIRLVGHTDPVGSLSYNKSLGQKRAQAVKDKLLKAIDDLQKQMPASVTRLSITIDPQSKGETVPRDTSGSAAAAARNRRVEVFVPNTSQSFFAQYDVRTLPGDDLFGLDGNPDLSDAVKTSRATEVTDVANLLAIRRNRRAADARVAKITAAAALPATHPLRAAATDLSKVQLDLYRELLPDGSGGIAFANLQIAFEQFANGELRSAHPVAATNRVGEPNSSFFFLFAEFAFLCVDSKIDDATWSVALRTMVKAQEIFIHAYPVAPAAAPPPVGAPLPAPCSPQPAACTFRSISGFDTSAFKVVGQSSAARKQALRAKYDTMTVDQLRKAAMEVLLRAQR